MFKKALGAKRTVTQRLVSKMLNRSLDNFRWFRRLQYKTL